MVKSIFFGHWLAILSGNVIRLVNLQRGNTVTWRVKFLAIAVFISQSIFSPGQAEAAATVKPKVGQCFMHTKADVSASYPMKNPINCSAKHNSETYLVGKWPLNTPPDELPEGDGLEIAISLCNAWGKTGILQGSYFNYFSWFTPSPEDWAKGERWLRCDGMKLVDFNEPYRYVSWSGKKLKLKSRY